MAKRNTKFGAPGGNDPAVGRATQFGQPGGNKQGDQWKANSQRQFYRWCEKATMEELQAFIADESNGALQIGFVKTCLKAIEKCDPSFYFDLTNQTHGLPKQIIEQQSLPEVVVKLE